MMTKLFILQIFLRNSLLENKHFNTFLFKNNAIKSVGSRNHPCCDHQN